MQKHIESPLSVKMLRGDFSNGDCVNVDATEDNGLEFSAISEKKSGNKTKDKKNKNEVPAEEKVVKKPWISKATMPTLAMWASGGRYWGRGIFIPPAAASIVVFVAMCS